ncbi:MAG: ribosome recycling factor [Oscillospiraceae bacterium]|nr:ribosome recycling factor [Oscillospiraceae bacterium]MBQ4544424.1 ribosome recycling factor [Oscillospiraceae bacterium]MBQ6901665.1 ribosome recycling factor [Oscillospiraceae bacterium]
MRPEVKEFDERMQKSISVVGEEFAAVRAGRANPAVLDKITVDYYGTPTPIPQIGSVSVPEPRVLLIQPWDASVLKGVEKAILASDLGITPANDGKCIRLAFPQLTEERRRDLIKQVKKIGEDGKVAVRNIRRDALDKFKGMKKKSEITEDDLKALEEEVQKITDKSCKDIDAMTEKKEKELLEF